MNKFRKSKFALVAVVIFSMVTMYGYIPVARATTSLTDAKDVISESAPSVAATHTATFTFASNIVAGGYYDIAFVDAASFGAIAADGSITCGGAGGVASRINGNKTARCTYAGGLANSSITTAIAGVTNPAATGPYTVRFTTYTDTGIVVETSDVIIYIVSSVSVTAHVDATLTFTVEGVANGQNINGVTTDVTTTATTTAFGTLTPNTRKVVGQKLTVATNASKGYTVSVQEDAELATAAGATINSFNNAQDGSGSTTPVVWADPSNDINKNWTWGHMGLTTTDTALSGGANFAGTKFAGLNGAAPMEVMSHTGPVNGASSGEGVGQTSVAYAIKIGALQEAGDYSTALTYMVTPTY